MQPQPVPKPEKNRLLQDGRDMFWSMVPLVLACLALAGLVGMCSFQGKGPTVGKIPSYDAVGALNADAQTLGFPVRMPALPDGWQPNSGARDGIDAGRTDPVTGQQVRAKVSTVGYITASGKYLSLTQSDADEQNLVRYLHADRVPAGTEDVAGVKWIVYRSPGDDTDDTDDKDNGEPVWTTRIAGTGGATQIALTGAGSDDEFRTLAGAVQTASPLPTTR